MIYLVMDADEVSPEHTEYLIDFGDMPLEKVDRLTALMRDRGRVCSLIARFPEVEFVAGSYNDDYFSGKGPHVSDRTASDWKEWISPHRFFNYRRRIDRETDKMTYIEVEPIEETFALFSREELDELLGIFKVNAADEEEDDDERVVFTKIFEKELENR